ncbi:hypothetical protein Bca4012_006742 [Brassica carinata]
MSSAVFLWLWSTFMSIPCLTCVVKAIVAGSVCSSTCRGFRSSYGSSSVCDSVFVFCLVSAMIWSFLLSVLVLAWYRELMVQVFVVRCCYVGHFITYSFLCLVGSWQECRLFNDWTTYFYYPSQGLSSVSVYECSLL